MNDQPAIRIHWSFWLIGVVSLIWNGLGCVNFVVQMNTEALAEFPEALQAIVIGRPVWATAGFAVAVSAGALGSVLLLLRNPAAFYVFIASLLGALLTMLHTSDVMTQSPGDYGAMRVFGYIVLPLLVAAFLIWYAKNAETRGWIG